MVRAHEWDVSRRLHRAPSRRPWWLSHPRPTPAVLGLERESAGPVVVITVRGELDGRSAPALEAFVGELQTAGCRVLEIDLSGVGTMASAGLSVLLGVRRWCEQRGLDLRLRAVPPSVWRVFEMSGLDTVFAPATPVPAGDAQELALF
jgi:anti-sigma B factor antagonist